MKKLLILAAALLSSITLAQQAASPTQNSAAPPSFKAHVLSNVELDKWIAQPDKILFIDVRRPDEVSSIGGFPVYLSIQLSDLEKSLQWIPKGRTIITVSNHANRAGKAADLLAAKGFKVAGAAGADTYATTGGKFVTKIAIPPSQSSAASTTTNNAK